MPQLSRKTVATEAVIQTVRLALEVTGGGYTRSSDIERLYRDVHGCRFHPLPRAKQTHLTRARGPRHEPGRLKPADQLIGPTASRTSSWKTLMPSSHFGLRKPTS